MVKYPHVGLRIPQEMKKTLDRIALEEDRTLSYLVRRAIDQYLARREDAA